MAHRAPTLSTQVFEHPLWDLRTVQNDIALLKLAMPVSLSRIVSAVCLPSANASFPAGSLCTTTGWGKTRYNGERPEGFSGVRLILYFGLNSKHNHKLQVNKSSISLLKTLLMKTLPNMNKNEG